MSNLFSELSYITLFTYSQYKLLNNSGEIFICSTLFRYFTFYQLYKFRPPLRYTSLIFDPYNKDLEQYFKNNMSIAQKLEILIQAFTVGSYKYILEQSTTIGNEFNNNYNNVITLHTDNNINESFNFTQYIGCWITLKNLFNYSITNQKKTLIILKDKRYLDYFITIYSYFYRSNIVTLQTDQDMQKINTILYNDLSFKEFDILSNNKFISIIMYLTNAIIYEFKTHHTENIYILKVNNKIDLPIWYINNKLIIFIEKFEYFNDKLLSAKNKIIFFNPCATEKLFNSYIFIKRILLEYFIIYGPLFINTSIENMFNTNLQEDNINLIAFLIANQTYYHDFNKISILLNKLFFIIKQIKSGIQIFDIENVNSLYDIKKIIEIINQ